VHLVEQRRRRQRHKGWPTGGQIRHLSIGIALRGVVAPGRSPVIDDKGHTDKDREQTEMAEHHPAQRKEILIRIGHCIGPPKGKNVTLGP